MHEFEMKQGKNLTFRNLKSIKRKRMSLKQKDKIKITQFIFRNIKYSFKIPLHKISNRK